MKKFLIIMLTVFALMPITVSTAFAADNFHNTENINPQNSVINDTYGLFDEDMLAGLTMLVQEKAEELDMNIYIFIAGESYRMSDSQTEIFADDNYDELYGEDTDGVFYFMDFTGKKPAFDYISTSGKAVLMYQKNIQSIHDACQSLLPPSSVSDYSAYKDDVGVAISQFLTQLDYYYDDSPSGYYHDNSSDKYFYYKSGELKITHTPPLSLRLRTLKFAIPIGIISAIIFYFATKSKYKFKTPANAVAYVSHDNTKFLRKDDRFIRTYTTKQKIEQNSGSHSGGGGHSHSGGHGGGGSHR